MDYFKKPKNSLEIQFELFNEAENAFLEIKNDSPTLLNKNDYISWVEKHKELYSKITIIFPSIEPSIDDSGIGAPFKYVYYWLNRLVDYLNHEDKIKTLLQDYKALRFDIESDVLHWLIENEELGSKLTVFRWGCLDRERLIEGYILFLKKQDIHVLESDFNILKNFQAIFDELYWEKLTHYAIDSEFVDDYSLKFYLEKRGIQI